MPSLKDSDMMMVVVSLVSSGCLVSVASAVRNALTSQSGSYVVR